MPAQGASTPRNSDKSNRPATGALVCVCARALDRMRSAYFRRSQSYVKHAQCVCVLIESAAKATYHTHTHTHAATNTAVTRLCSSDRVTGSHLKPAHFSNMFAVLLAPSLSYTHACAPHLVRMCRRTHTRWPLHALLPTAAVHQP